MSKDIHASRQNRRLHLLSQIGNLSRVNQGATNIFDERVGQFLGVNETDRRCLDIIERLGRMSAGQLANHSGLTTGAVTAVIDRLEAAGYVTRVRDPLDRRKIWVEVTAHFSQLVQTIFGVYDLIGPVMMRHFTQSQLEGIVAFLRMGTKINQELAAGLKENMQPGLDPAAQLERAQQFRRAVEAITPRLSADLDRILPPGDGEG
jgi:DNA-binding MarR family transcriptional regulator